MDSLVVHNHMHIPEGDFLGQTTTRFMTVKDGRLVSDIPHLPHRHVHAHPLGDEPHPHHD